ncbi:sulfatase-like hydrolase/transferase [Sinomicrobium sp. M5D2P17]
MKIKKHYSLFFAIIAFLSCKTEKKEQNRLQDEKPNIIIIMADDLGNGDVGYHGSDIKTPNIDSLSREGIVLNRFYVAPVCSPTRAGLMTGRYPDRFGLRETVIPPWRDFGVDTTEVFLPEILAKAGYKNRAAFGKWHLGHSRQYYHPLKRGFTHFYGHYNGAIDYFTHKREGELDWHNDFETSYDKGYATDLITEEAVKSIQDYSGESPFFLYIAYNAPHGPLQAKKEDLLKYGFEAEKPLFSKKKGYGEIGRGNTRRQTYSAMVTSMDQGIGKIMKTLKKLGIENNTLVLFLSDNGPAPNEGGTTAGLRGHKFQEWDGGVRVPAVMKWPNGFEGGRTVDQVMGYIDVLPTLKEIAGIRTKPEKTLDGVNMLPVLTGKKQRMERDFYLGYGAIVNTKWKLVKKNSRNPSMRVNENMLFNMQEDPGETTNIKEKHSGIFERLKKTANNYDTIESKQEVPPYQDGKKGFKAPKEWNIEDYPE